MIAPRTSALALATVLLVAACGGGDDEGSTTTSSSIEDTTSTSVQPTTTTIDPALRDLVLVAEDLSGFKESTTAEPADPEGSNAPTCGDPAIAPAGRALDEEPFVDGPTLVRGADDAIEVSSTVISTTAEKAEAALKEAIDPKAVECLEGDFRTVLEKDLPAGTTLEFKTTSTESSVPGVDQAILVSSTVTVKAATSRTLRVDFVFLRKAGIILSINYLGPTNLATSAERQRIVAVAAKKLAGDSGTSTTSAAGGGSTSSSRGATSSTRRGSTTTRQGGSTSSSSRSTTSTTR